MTSSVQMARKLVIFGTGGAGREVAQLARTCRGPAAKIVFAVDSDRYDPPSDASRFTVETPESLAASSDEVEYVVAVGDPNDRSRIVARLTALGAKFATLVHPTLRLSPDVKIGEGTIICEGALLTTDIEIGRHVYVNIGATVSHDCILGDYATLSPGVHIAGRVHIGSRVFVGIGATVINGEPGAPISIGDGAVIGAGACVIDHVARMTVVAGVPARPIHRKAPATGA